MGAPETSAACVVVANARWELLRMLAFMRDLGGGRAAFPTRVPLFIDEWQNDDADILLAARECQKVGEVHASGLHLTHTAMAGITDLGYRRVRALDALGEAAQEVPHNA